MKKQSRFRWPRIGTRNHFLFLILLPALAWWAAVSARSFTITPGCLNQPDQCTVLALPWVDRFSIGSENSRADLYSYYTQNFSGALAVAVPTGWAIGQAFAKTLTPAVFWVSLVTDLAVVFQTVAWNGLATETSHILTHRPRPFVFADSERRGEASNYTSFYSGHTSFVAATQTILLLLLFARGAPTWLLLLFLGLGESLILSTAYFRIMAGRHFLTDVICGAIAGTWIALLSYAYFRKNSRSGT